VPFYKDKTSVLIFLVFLLSTGLPGPLSEVQRAAPLPLPSSELVCSEEVLRQRAPPGAVEGVDATPADSAPDQW
jgi:hypothetical protein